MTKWQKIIFLLILTLAFVLRFYKLGEIPAGFHADEAAFGYNAYSISLTGKDEYGSFFPLALKSFGDYKPALYAYLDILPIMIFGLTPFAVRFISGLFGFLTVILFYFLTVKLMSSHRLAFLSSFLLAISPWHINLSRTTSEVVISLFFIILMLYALVYLKDRFSIKWFMIAVVGGVLGISSYTASRFFVVLLVGIFLVFSISNIERKINYQKVLIFIFALLMTFAIFYSFVGSISRFKQIDVFHHPETKLVLEEQIREDQSTPILVTRFFHNKIVNYGRTILENYSQYFTLDFLVINGGSPPRVSVPATGLFYLWQIPFLIWGIHCVFKKKEKNGFFLIFWWLITLIPASLTFDEIPNVYRTLIIVPPILGLISIGIDESPSLKPGVNPAFSKLFIGVIVLIGLWELLYYQHQYYVHQRFHRPWYRHYGYEELVSYITLVKDQYRETHITKSYGSPYIFFLFYQKYDPKIYWAAGSPRDKDWGGFDKYVFIPKDCPWETGELGAPGTLYANAGTCKLPTFEMKTKVKLIKTILREDKTVAFYILGYVD